MKKSTTRNDIYNSPGTDEQTFNNIRPGTDYQLTSNFSPEGSPGQAGDNRDIGGAGGDNRNATSMIFVCREVIQEVLDMESNVESLRKELSYRQDFNLGAAF